MRTLLSVAAVVSLFNENSTVVLVHDHGQPQAALASNNTNTNIKLTVQRHTSDQPLACQQPTQRIERLACSDSFNSMICKYNHKPFRQMRI